ncbi:MAG: glycosyltransferase family 39 protein [Pseudomonadota bacterium]|nr:glycosyltransferase family 39 protein [Pseudomonadota bacterium]MEE3100859.1 glycosyltransferase family 39 protein [Pseudomonadota bacterium]
MTTDGTDAPKPRRAARAAAKPAGRPRGKAAEAALWRERTLWLLLGLCLLRLAINAAALVPVHFDEAQYWAYGRELAFGHYSKPPLVGWLIEASTAVFGDTLFGLRFFAPLAHLAIGAMIFLTARRLFDARTGFWAALVYSAAPGVSVSALLMTTDPPMMAGWALALYALVRVAEVRPGKKTAEPYAWWAVMGAAVGAGMMAKYTGGVFVAGALGYALLSRERPIAPTRRKGALIALAAGLAALGPNLVWNAGNGFVTFAHLGENAEIRPDRGLVHPGEFGEFFGAQFGVIGPVAFAAILAALALMAKAEARADWKARLLAWQTAPLLGAMCVQALLSQAQPNWAAPAYVAGSILAARFLLARDWGGRALRLHAWIGGAALAGVLALGAVYSVWATDLPRAGDPFKKMRIGGPFCEAALSAMEGEGADALLSNDRRRLSECLFQGGLDFTDAAIWDPDGRVSNHFEFRSRLEPGDARLFLLAVEGEALGEDIAGRFLSAEPLGTGEFRTHEDRAVSYSLWLVEGFEGY